MLLHGNKTHLLHCSYCDKKFVTETCLKLHVRTHTKEKPYVCYTCGKTFAQACNLRGHETKHFFATTYKCYVCFKYYSTEQYRNKHKKLHETKMNKKKDDDLITQ